MVLPETPGAPDPTDRSENPRLRLIGIVGAAILILAAIPVLGNLTSVDPESADPTVTTTTMAPTPTTFEMVEVGTPIELEPLIALDAPAFAIVELDGKLLIFSRGPGDLGATLIIYDGRSESAPSNPVIVGAYVNDVVSTGDGLLAYGHQLAPYRPTAWRSRDGLSWSAEVLPMGQADGVPLLFTDAISTDEMLIITALASSSYKDRILDHEAWNRLTDRFGEFVRGFGLRPTPDGDVIFEVYGPLGLDFGVAWASELGLDPTPYRQLSEGPRPIDTDIRSLTWVSVRGGSWDVLVTESPLGPHRMFTGRDGWVWSTNFFESGLLATPDGSNWIRVPSTHVMLDVRNWGSGYSGKSSEGVLMTSPDAINWRQLDLSGLLGRPGEWYLDPYDSAAGGLAVAVSQFAGRAESSENLLKSDGDLELLLSMGDLIIRESGTERFRTDLSLPSPWVLLDLEAGIIDLTDPRDGGVLMTLTVEELARFEGVGWRSNLARQYLLFTRDGVGWTLQDLNWLPHVTGVDMMGHTLYVRVLEEGTEFLLRGDLP
jgi:hypothetical protein